MRGFDNSLSNLRCAWALWSYTDFPHAVKFTCGKDRWIVRPLSQTICNRYFWPMNGFEQSDFISTEIAADS